METDFYYLRHHSHDTPSSVGLRRAQHGMIGMIGERGEGRAICNFSMSQGPKEMTLLYC